MAGGTTKVLSPSRGKNKNCFIFKGVGNIPKVTGHLVINPLGDTKDFFKSNFLDIDECATSNAGCQTDCTNTDGSFFCGCAEGYEVSLNGFSCQGERFEGKNLLILCVNSSLEESNLDVEECLTGQDTCDASSSICRNTVGSFECDCNAGYEASGPNTCTG